jgi:hypothetical protein
LAAGTRFRCALWIDLFAAWNGLLNGWIDHVRAAEHFGRETSSLAPRRRSISSDEGIGLSGARIDVSPLPAVLPP